MVLTIRTSTGLMVRRQSGRRAFWACSRSRQSNSFGCQKRAPSDPSVAGSFFPLTPGSTWTYRVIDKRQNNTEFFTDRALGQERVGPEQASGDLVSEHFGSDENGSVTILYTVEDGYVTRAFGIDDHSHALFQERGFLP